MRRGITAGFQARWFNTHRTDVAGVIFFILAVLLCVMLVKLLTTDR
ncbi:MAG: hypothetical protein NTX64_11415 [Elusimicrobia bacterium]|nr:hypothetical protein [Elusimicrobiota bacterium]